MGFGDWNQIWGPAEIANKQAEAANGVLGRLPIAAYGQIQEFGVYITEDFIAQAQDLIVKLQKEDKYAGTATDLKALTVGTANTKLYKGNGTQSRKTLIAADTDLDNGHVVYANLGNVNITVKPGDVLVLNQTQDATGAGGAYIPFVVLRFSMGEYVLSKTWYEAP